MKYAIFALAIMIAVTLFLIFTKSPKQSKYLRNTDVSAETLQLLEGYPWLWAGASVDGEEIVPNVLGDFMLEFPTSGTFTSTTDCRKFVGVYAISTTKIDFEFKLDDPVICTIKDAVESKYLMALASMETYAIKPGHALELANTSGDTMVFYSQ